MLKILIFWSILLLVGGPVLAQTPAHRAATNLLRNQQSPPGAPANLAANQFSSEQAARGHCPGDAVVWANLGASKVYHTSADRYYGKTKHGAFMCQKEADQSGFHPAGARAGNATKNAGGNATK